MSVGEYVYKIMLDEGAQIPDHKRQEVINQVEDAAVNRRFLWLERAGKIIGFLTYMEKNNKVFINNCIIYKSYRNAFNFIALRRFFRSNFKGKQFYWENKRKNDKLCFVK